MNDEMQDDLEKKIDEAEMEAQLEESSPETSFETSVPDEDQDQKKKEKKPSKARLIFRRILIWLVILALAFAGGFFVDSYLRYQPTLDQVNSLTTQLDAAEEEIADFEAEVIRLGTFEEKNQVLEEELNQAVIHLTLLSARLAVADATLAVEQNRLADAKLSLDKVGTTLESLKATLNEDQAEVVENMIQRQQLILIELEDDQFSAQTDLEVLASKLTSLENTLFTTP
jgi:hypothetical protein